MLICIIEQVDTKDCFFLPGPLKWPIDFAEMTLTSSNVTPRTHVCGSVLFLSKKSIMNAAALSSGYIHGVFPTLPIRILRKTPLFFESVFPMFVPSLSW